MASYDGKIAVVSAVSSTSKGSFQGIGMASTEKDKEIAPAILELAEKRAIARSMHFAGYGLGKSNADLDKHCVDAYGTVEIIDFGCLDVSQRKSRRRGIWRMI